MKKIEKNTCSEVNLIGLGLVVSKTVIDCLDSFLMLLFKLKPLEFKPLELEPSFFWDLQLGGVRLTSLLNWKKSIVKTVFEKHIHFTIDQFENE